MVVILNQVILQEVDPLVGNQSNDLTNLCLYFDQESLFATLPLMKSVSNQDLDIQPRE
jgi:hypothetical protein